MEQLINDFSPGLFIMQTVIFLILLFILVKVAWKPILNSIRVREDSIKDALEAAEKAKEEMAKLQSDNQKLLEEARKERDVILKEAREVAAGLQEEAKTEANKQAEKMIADAKMAINTEKQAAMAEVKTQVATLSLQITEKLLRKSLESDKAQKDLINEFVKDIKLN
ncbi:F0F1 ATP synthase subunit B [Fulvivirga lutimaris]|uniref:F0F1 ATP synthase subunit B n=1 Tax=Fulvivirga lutimaris TaxID=1819566 RepID=UPI0012BD0336|nr:F0F1 ATP synthase subunit B [Fulvivirga lutimaris]MTI41346.1 F0F1 ATP synthase subunit B [Fulvivirga lutimaris]